MTSSDLLVGLAIVQLTPAGLRRAMAGDEQDHLVARAGGGVAVVW